MTDDQVLRSFLNDLRAIHPIGNCDNGDTVDNIIYFMLEWFDRKFQDDDFETCDMVLGRIAEVFTHQEFHMPAFCEKCEFQLVPGLLSSAIPAKDKLPSWAPAREWAFNRIREIAPDEADAILRFL